MSTFLGPHKEHESLDREASAGDWIAIGSSYYMAAIIPKTPGFRLRGTADVKTAPPGRGGTARARW